MSILFVIKNQDELYLTKQSEWEDGRDANQLFKSPHHDIALNTLIEVNSKDITLRGEIISVDSNAKGLPVVEVTAQAQLTMEALDANTTPANDDNTDSELIQLSPK